MAPADTATVSLPMVQLLARIAALAGAYAFGGWIGLSLAVPPGYATIIWPASGIALAAMLLWGRAVWPGIVLGSFTLNLANALFGAAPDGDPMLLAASSLLIGIGAGVEALAGCYLLGRFKAGVELSSLKHLGALIVLGALVPCVVAASIGVNTLMAFGVLPPDLFLQNWVTWWLGDVLGIVFILPLLFFTQYSPVPMLWKARQLAGASGLVALCLIASLGGTFYLWKSVSEREYAQAFASFEAVAADADQALLHRFNSYVRALDGAAGYYAVADTVTADNWRTYVGSLDVDTNLPGMNGLGYIFAVADEDIPRFLAQAEREGIANFSIHPDVDDAEHFVIKLVEPLDRNLQAQGLDLTFEEGRRSAILRSRESGAVTLTQRITLVQDQQKGSGFLLIRPIVEDSGDEVRVWAYSPLIASSFLSHLTPRESDEYVLRAYQGDTAAVPELIYQSENLDETNSDPQFAITRSLEIAGQRWTLVWTSRPAFEQRVFSREPLIVLSSGLLITGLLGVLLSTFMRREAIIRRKIDEGTDAVSRLAAQREQALEQLNKNNRLLKMTEATANIGHWRLDYQTDELFWSDEVYRIHGMEPGPPPSLADAVEAYHPDDRARVTAIIAEAHAMGKATKFSARLVHKNGAVRMVDSTVRPELGEDGETIALFGILEDRTDEITLRNELVAARDDAQAAALAKSAFLANMSHEIRTPMNGVLGFAELLTTADLPPKQHKHAGMILESGRNMMRLLNDVLDLSKVEAGRMGLVDRPLDMRHVLRGSMELVGPISAQKGLELDLQIDPSVPNWIMGDKLRLRQIIGNLLNNAVKFTDSGSVILKASATDDDGTKQLVVSVIDSGIGIAPTDQERIFEGFSQGQNDANQRFGGTGLGLAISASLADLMGGKITVESTVGRGSTFRLAIPYRESEAVVVSTAEPRKPAIDFAGKILVAEDNKVNQMLMTAMLDTLGVRFDMVFDGEEAVARVCDAAAHGEAFAMVLMDIQMPKLDGYQACRQLRDLGFSGARLPIVALTANAFAEDEDKALEAGMQAHIAKPLKMANLELLLARFPDFGSAGFRAAEFPAEDA